MGVIILILLFLIPGWVAFITARAMRREKVSTSWWWSAFALLLMGVVVGIWAGFFFEYQPSPKLRLAGCPLPVAIFRLDDGVWIDYVHEPLIMIGIGLMDVLLVVLVFLLPFSATYWIRHLRRPILS